MAVLHVLEQGATLRLRSGRLRVEIDEQLIADAPARKVGMVVVHGNVRLTTPALTFLLREGKPILFCSLSAQLHGVAGRGELATPERLRAQFAAVGSPAQLELARAFVVGKVRSSRALLGRFAAKHERARTATHELDRILQRIGSSPSLEQLRGFEGIAARNYFLGLQGPLSPFGFTGRNRRPPRDPTNAALSYGYALLLPRILLAVRAAGLHSEVGMLHAESRRNPAMALDLMEEFRVPVVDFTVTRSFLRGALKPSLHFEDRSGGIYLNDAGRKLLVSLIEGRLREETNSGTGLTYGSAIERQAQRVAAALSRGRPYEPFRFERHR